MSEAITGLDFDLDNDVQELVAAEPGEAELRIIRADIGQQDGTKGNSKYIKMNLELVDDEEGKYKDISHILMIPDGDQTPKDNEARKRRIRDFVRAFSVQWPAETVEDLEAGWVGQTGWALLTSEDSAEYGEQNRIRKPIAGK